MLIQIKEKEVEGLFGDSMVNKICAAFDFIDEGVEKGFERVSEKYKSLLLEDSEIVEQTSIFDF